MALPESMVLHRVVRPLRPLVALSLVLLLVGLSPLAAGGHHPHQPYYVEHERAGKIGCSIAFTIIQGSDHCQDLDPDAVSRFEVPLDPYLTTMVFALESSGAVFDPELVVNFVRPAGAFQEISGPAPFFRTYNIDEDNAWPSWDDPPDLAFNVRVHPANTPQIAYQTSFHICIGLFYHHEPVPEGYHPCND